MVGYAEQAQLDSWAAHPLVKALLAQPLSHPSLMLGTQRILSQAAQAGKNQQQLLQQLLVPVVSFVLLQTHSDDGGMSTCSVISTFAQQAVAGHCCGLQADGHD